MTTSILLTHGRYLNENDLQTLLDYAQDPKCPYEWRMAMEQLIDAYREYKVASEAEEERDDAVSDLMDASKQMRKLNDRLDLLIPGDGTENAKNMDVWMPKLRTELQLVLNEYNELQVKITPTPEPTEPSGAASSGAAAGDPGSRPPG